VLRGFQLPIYEHLVSHNLGRAVRAIGRLLFIYSCSFHVSPHTARNRLANQFCTPESERKVT